MIIKDYLVTVCSSCETASCWHGEFVCQNFQNSNIKSIKASELKKKNLEHPNNYSYQKIKEICGFVKEI